jgi:hypothetical protein
LKIFSGRSGYGDKSAMSGLDLGYDGFWGNDVCAAELQ